MEVTAFIGLGGNLGDARKAVHDALAALDALPSTSLVQASSLYRTTPIDAYGPDFINGVAEIRTQVAPLALLNELQRIEAAAGRERPHRNAPRTLDLDLLFYADLRLDSDRLILPHPRISQRAFVLVPLAEIAPGLVTHAQLEAVAGQSIERLPPTSLPP